MDWYWYLYNNCSLFRYVRHFYLYVLKIDWKLQLVAFLMIIMLAVIMRKKYKLQKITLSKAFASVNLPVYIFILFSSLVFSRTTLEEVNVNLQPFWTEIAIMSGETKYIQTLLQNLFMLVPYGALVPMVKKVTFRTTLISGLLLSILIEMLQLITKTGLCEVDDIIHNTVGVAIGYGFFVLQKRSVKNQQKKRQKYLKGIEK